MKKGYREYDPVIYPRLLWVHIGNDPKGLFDVFEGLNIEDNTEYYGCTWDMVERKSDNKYGSLVSFPSRKVMNMDVISHEASHVVDAFEKAMGMEHGGEASAYLIGWVASCINKARLGQGDFIEIMEKKK